MRYPPSRSIKPETEVHHLSSITEADQFNAGELSARDIQIALWGISGRWWLRLQELGPLADRLGVTEDMNTTTPSECFAFLVYLERSLKNASL